VTAPSGEQIELAFGEQQVVVVEVGGGLRTYAVAGRDVLDGYGVDELSSSGRGQVLLPWPNRVQGGAYEFAGRSYQLALDEPTAGNAIHGLVRWAGWTVAERTESRVVVRHTLQPTPGYPFRLELEIDYALTVAGLAVRTKATNASSEPCPFGSGAHPYLRAGTSTVDSLLLRAPARFVLDADEHGIPTGTHPVDGTEHDFRDSRPIGATKLDHAFTGLDRDGDGLARVELRHPDGEGGVSVWMDGSYGYAMLFTGDTQPDVDRRSIAIEPMTCAPNAFRSGDGLIVLEPGGSFEGAWGISPLRAGSG
jgi:aldose 1-epimerase